MKGFFGRDPTRGSKQFTFILGAAEHEHHFVSIGIHTGGGGGGGALRKGEWEGLARTPLPEALGHHRAPSLPTEGVPLPEPLSME